MKKRKGFEAITIVLLVLIVITAVYIVAYHFLPNMRLLVIAATSKMAGQLQLAVRQCQAFHEELNFLGNMVDTVGIRKSMSEAGLNGGGGPINCCYKGATGCPLADSAADLCIKKCASLLKLYEECSKYPTPGVDCYKDAATRGEVEDGVEAPSTTPTPTGGTPTPTPTSGSSEECQAKDVRGYAACAKVGKVCVSSSCSMGCSDAPAAEGPCGCKAQCVVQSPLPISDTGSVCQPTGVTGNVACASAGKTCVSSTCGEGSPDCKGLVSLSGCCSTPCVSGITCGGGCAALPLAAGTTCGYTAQCTTSTPTPTGGTPTPTPSPTLTPTPVPTSTPVLDTFCFLMPDGTLCGAESKCLGGVCVASTPTPAPTAT